LSTPGSKNIKTTTATKAKKEKKKKKRKKRKPGVSRGKRQIFGSSIAIVSFTWISE